MTKKYAVYDPILGEVKYYDDVTVVDMNNMLAEKILNDYLRLTHNTLWSVVDIDENGMQHWGNAENKQEFDNPAIIQKIVALMAEKQRGDIVKKEITKEEADFARLCVAADYLEMDIQDVMKLKVVMQQS
jgi:hypothetical protein